jgi:hypothetical protein
MKKIIVIACFLLASCAHTAVPVTTTFPEAPELLRQDCETLTRLAENAKLSDVMIAITENYVKYAKCKKQNQAWNDWYNEQQKIFDTATKPKPFWSFGEK